MSEMEQVMWREGDLMRARLEEARGKIEQDVSHSMGSLGLTRQYLPARKDGKEAKAAEAAEEEGAKTQGDALRASRARNLTAGSSKVSNLTAPGNVSASMVRGRVGEKEVKETRSSSWDRAGLRLTRK